MNDLDTLIVLDGFKGISRADALAFLNGKRELLDANSAVGEYLSLAGEYASIGEHQIADDLRKQAVDCYLEAHDDAA